MRALLILAAALTILPPAGAAADLPDLPDLPDLDDHAAVRRALAAAAAADDDPAAMDALWSALQSAGRLPYVAGDSVMFLYRGEAADVAVAGDFNGWDPAAGPATRLGAGDLWIREEAFPRDARLDYKFVRDGDTWLLDAANPRRQRGGFGDNSELRMPGYVPSPWVDERPGVPRGALAERRLASEALGYAVDYVVYRPAGPPGDQRLPVVYVTDGHEYRDPLMGGMVQVLDNMIAAGAIEPVMAVFVDPRTGGRNRRAEQYVLNPAFARFLAHELAPTVDAAWATIDDRRARAILGTSLGGLNAAYVGAQETGSFGLVGCQSPAFQAGGGNILRAYEQAPRLPLDMVMTWGTFHDFGEHTVRMQQILDAKGYACTRVVVHEGHSWGNWRGLLDDVLRVWFGVD